MKCFSHVNNCFASFNCNLKGISFLFVLGRGQEYWEQENIIEGMPACRQMFNIFHPFDPVAYRYVMVLFLNGAVFGDILTVCQLLMYIFCFLDC